MFVYQSGLGREQGPLQGTRNETSTPRDPQQVPKPKYEATAFKARSSIGYPNTTSGQYVWTQTFFDTLVFIEAPHKQQIDSLRN